MEMQSQVIQRVPTKSPTYRQHLSWNLGCYWGGTQRFPPRGAGGVESCPNFSRKNPVVSTGLWTSCSFHNVASHAGWVPTHRTLHIPGSGVGVSKKNPTGSKVQIEPEHHGEWSLKNSIHTIIQYTLEYHQHSNTTSTAMFYFNFLFVVARKSTAADKAVPAWWLQCLKGANISWLRHRRNGAYEQTNEVFSCAFHVTCKTAEFEADAFALAEEADYLGRSKWQCFI